MVLIKLGRVVDDPWLTVGEGEEDMKYRRTERQKCVGIATHGLPLCQVSRTTP